MNEKLAVSTYILSAIITADWKFPVENPSEWDVYAIKRATDLADKLLANCGTKPKPTKKKNETV
jgi:hypothetical protein